MIRFEAGPGFFQYRVVGVCIHDGHVLLHRAAPNDDRWSLPGGRCELLETAEAALAREIHEELGLTVTVGRLRWVVEHLFTFNGRPWHELGLYFEISLPPGCHFLDTSRSHAGQEASQPVQFRWFQLAQLNELPFYPDCLRGPLQAPPLDGPQHLVESRLDEPAHPRHHSSDTSNTLAVPVMRLRDE